MTPAMLLELKEQQSINRELEALPIDKFLHTYVNAHRDMGGKDADGTERPAADPINFEAVRTYYGSRSRNLAAKFKKDKVDRSLYGANADREAFEAWAGASVGAEFVPTPPTKE